MPLITMQEIKRLRVLIESGNISDPCHMLDVIMERKTNEPEECPEDLLESDTQEN